VFVTPVSGELLSLQGRHLFPCAHGYPDMQGRDESRAYKPRDVGVVLYFADKRTRINREKSVDDYGLPAFRNQRTF